MTTRYRWIRFFLGFLAVSHVVVMFHTVRHVHNTNNNIPNNNEAPTIRPVAPVESVKYDGDDDDDVDEQRRTVYWLDQSTIDVDKDDYFSGAWYMPIQNFRSLNAEDITHLEDASHVPFFENRENVRMTVDWLDFAVEHMSRWYKKLNVLSADNNDVAINKITGNFLKFIQATPARTNALMAMTKSKAKLVPTTTSTIVTRPLLHPTIAVISFDAILKDNSTPLEMERSRYLTMTTLGATIASLLRVGFGRIVCTGIADIDERYVMDTFDLIRRQYKDYFAKNDHDNGDAILTTELAYVRITDKKMYKTEYYATGHGDVSLDNRPKASIYGLQKALTGKYKKDDDDEDEEEEEDDDDDEDEDDVTKMEQWLGTVHEPSYWKYVYSTEPDLILQTRVASHPAIHEALEQGRVLMPHRLQPVTHESDLIHKNNNHYSYNGSSDNLPAQGKFKNILDIDGDRDMCCDGGITRPKWNNEDDPTDTMCSTWWWDCGFTAQWQNLGISEEIKHRRLLYYTPLIRLSQGTNIISISGSEHSRKCQPRKRNTPNDICERPLPSGRSYSIRRRRSR